jgi:hypothetical protein
MPKLIACLGYDLKEDNSIDPILENRLRDSVDLCVKNPGSTLLLMGGQHYQDDRKNRVSQAFAMKTFLQTNFFNELKDTKIMVEKNTTSTIEQLCYLKKLIDFKEIEFDYSDLVIVSSQFFADRVKLYSEYIFSTDKNIIFIESDIPLGVLGQFKATEEEKLKEAQNWLKDYKKGDYQAILIQHKAFQDLVKKGQINQPIS